MFPSSAIRSKYSKNFFSFYVFPQCTDKFSNVTIAMNPTKIKSKPKPSTLDIIIVEQVLLLSASISPTFIYLKI